MRVVYLFLGLSFFLSCKSQPKAPVLPVQQNENTLLWEVSGNGLKRPSYIFGTFHLMCRQDINFSDNLKKALAASSEVYMELDMDDPATMLGGMLLVNMEKGKKLSNLLSPEEYSRVSKYFKDSLKTPIDMLQSMKPAMLGALLYPKMLPCKTPSGVEEQLMILAKKDNKEIKGLETMAFQASVFDSIPYEVQAKELLRSVDSAAKYRLYFDTMMMVYKSQRLNDIEKLFSRSEFGMADNEEVLLFGRNRNWVVQLKPIMKKAPVFVAVGAGHLVGAKGVIALLRKEGYTVRGIKN
jgi:uncharacterized protein